MKTSSLFKLPLKAIRFTSVLAMACAAFLSADAQRLTEARKQLFNDGWRYALTDSATQASSIEYDDSAWRKLDLPHDWSIEGATDADNPMGNDSGYYPDGISWYRKTFTMPQALKDKKVGIYFEGIYMNSQVFINGTLVGGQPYGYTSFHIDLTPHLKPGIPNVIAVRVDNSRQRNSRWYTGSGIYRHAWITVTEPTHIGHWGVAVTTPEANNNEATVKIRTTVSNSSNTDKHLLLSTALKQGDSEVGQEQTSLQLAAGTSAEVEQTISVTSPSLWSPSSPTLYKAHLRLTEAGQILDSTTETFGIRTIAYNTHDGFLLNGERILINGGCLHHDNGILGARAYDRAEVRKARLMKAAGFNTVRTSHNIPSEAFLNACDSLGLLVIDESFDAWRDSKTPHDYAELFDRWWKHDVTSMVLRDRNHPSIICWSTGNEVIERKKIEVVTTAQRLADAIRQTDPTRPVTSALAAWDSDWEIYDPLAAVHDIVGYNYMIHKHASDHQRVPSRLMWQTESYPREAFRNWVTAHDNSYILGDFVWTAIDYLGEAGIGRYYYEGETEGQHYERSHYPWHGAYCGDIDITGWRKPISHYRDLLYNTDKKTYMAVKEPDGYYGKIKETLWSVWPTWESWNWPGHEGKPIDVEVYTHCPKVQLYLNEDMIEEKTVNRSTEFKAVFTLPYAPGTLRAVGIKTDGTHEETQLCTADNPYTIRLTPDHRLLKADNQDLSFVTVEIVDAKGRVCPNAENLLQIEVSGAGSLAAAGNANLKDTGSYCDNKHKTWKGRALIAIKSGTKVGNIHLKVSGKGLKTSTIRLRAKK